MSFRSGSGARRCPFSGAPQKAHKPWQKAIEQLLKMGVRAEQQALAKWGLNYVIDEYLPAKLAKPAQFLP